MGEEETTEKKKKRKDWFSAGRESRTHHPASGDSGAAAVDGRRRSVAQGGEHPTSAETSTSRSPQPLSRCQESSKGQKSALTAVRQVGGRGEIHGNGPLWRNNTSERLDGVFTGPRMLSLSAGPQSRKAARAPERQLGPKQTVKNRRVNNGESL